MGDGQPSSKEAGHHLITLLKMNEEKRRKGKGHKFPAEAGQTQWKQKHLDVEEEGFT